MVKFHHVSIIVNRQMQLKLASGMDRKLAEKCKVFPTNIQLHFFQGRRNDLGIKL